MDSDLSPREDKLEGTGMKEPSTEAEAPVGEETSYGRVIVQLLLILPCAVLLIPTLLFGVIDLADTLQPVGQSRGMLSPGMMYILGFVCVVCGVFLPDRFAWRRAGILVVLAGLPLFIAGALAMSTKLRILGAGREVYEILVMFTGPVVVTAWNVVRLWKSGAEELAG
jgi:hypothetical protein